MVLSTLIAGGAVLGLLAAGRAQPEEADQFAPARELVERVVAEIRANDTDGAFALARPHWPIPEEEIDEVQEKTARQRRMLASRFGKSLGIERVRRETIGDRFVRYTYLERFERHAIVWRFVMYRPADEWIVNAVRWDDQIEALFEAPR
jgi:hypothetical protein